MFCGTGIAENDTAALAVQVHRSLRDGVAATCCVRLSADHVHHDDTATLNGGRQFVGM